MRAAVVGVRRRRKGDGGEFLRPQGPGPALIIGGPPGRSRAVGPFSSGARPTWRVCVSWKRPVRWVHPLRGVVAHAVVRPAQPSPVLSGRLAAHPVGDAVVHLASPQGGEVLHCRRRKQCPSRGCDTTSRLSISLFSNVWWSRGRPQVPTCLRRQLLSRGPPDTSHTDRQGLSVGYAS